jgi:hypothetical protein
MNTDPQDPEAAPGVGNMISSSVFIGGSNLPALGLMKVRVIRRP